MAVEAEEAGMDAFMEKPFRLEELTALYIKLLERDNRNQRDNFTRPGVDTLGVDTPWPTAVVRRQRLIRNVTPSTKIFIDASQQDGTPTIVIAKTSQKITTDPLTGSGIDNGTISGFSAKVHAEN